MAAFAAFWWMAAAIAFTKRGAQATDAGLPATSARNAVIALSWLEFAAFVVAAVAVALDRCAACSPQLPLPYACLLLLFAGRRVQMAGPHCCPRPAASAGSPQLVAACPCRPCDPCLLWRATLLLTAPTATSLTCRMRHAKHAAYLAAAAERLIDKKREADREAERERYRAASQASSQFKTATFELSPSASKSLSVTTTPMPSAAALQAPQLATAV